MSPTSSSHAPAAPAILDDLAPSIRGTVCLPGEATDREACCIDDAMIEARPAAKAAHDPHDFLHVNQNIVPTTATATAP